MRFVCCVIALWGMVIFGTVLFSRGVSAPKALLGAGMWIVASGFYAAKGFAFERKKRTPEFAAEHARLAGIFRVGSEVDMALPLVGSSYCASGDATGFSLRGRCRILDLKGPLADLRIEVKAGRIAHLHVAPKPVESWSDIIRAYRAELPRLSVDREARDWMGRPLDRK